MKNVISTTTMAAVLLWSGVSLATSIPAAESTGYLLNRAEKVERKAGGFFQHKIDLGGASVRLKRADGIRLLNYAHHIRPAQGSTAQRGRFGQDQSGVIGQIELPRKRWGLDAREDWWVSGKETGGDGTTPTPTPEPATMLLFGSGIAALAARMRKRSDKDAYSV